MKFNKSSATIGLILSQSISCVRAVHDGKPGSSPPKPLKITEWEDVQERNGNNDVDCFDLDVKCTFLDEESEKVSCAKFDSKIHGCDLLTTSFTIGITNIASDTIRFNTGNANGLAEDSPIEDSSCFSDLVDSAIATGDTATYQCGIDINFCTFEGKYGIFNLTGAKADSDSPDTFKCNLESKAFDFQSTSPTPAPTLSPTTSPTPQVTADPNAQPSTAKPTPQATKEPTSDQDPTSPPPTKSTKTSKSQKAKSSKSSKGKYYKYSCKGDRRLSSRRSSPSTSQKALPSYSSRRTKSKSTKSGKSGVWFQNPDPKSCDECAAIMENDGDQTIGGSEKLKVYYGLKIGVKSNSTMTDKEMESALKEVLNGYYQAEFGGCNPSSTTDPDRKLQVEGGEISTISLENADFNWLDLSVRGTKTFCSSKDENCMGGEGRIGMAYETDGDNRNLDISAITIYTLQILQENNETLAAYIPDLEELYFVSSATSRNAIIPQITVQSGWVLFPLIAGIMLTIYGAFVILREKFSPRYQNVEEDSSVNCGLFAPNDKLRSDDDFDLPPSTNINWDKVEIIVDDGILEVHDEFNRNSLASKAGDRFQIRTSITSGSYDPVS
ncbi:predicted protein [Chaetoceros tenuissimus]|uniref:Uncharacterized protein n=1 Tax=Chaetoceros tenuissimus TaxID=426638 RepID=A0AAD3CNI1_9STRA|nr:predicted protein [Chaetoceros tenuissimus]